MENLNSPNSDDGFPFVKDSPSNNEYQDRRRVEMERRFDILQSRRSHLENELEAVENFLYSLDRQMKNYAIFEQLSTHN